MTALTPKETAEYLGIVQKLRQSFVFHDMHVHPYEVLFDKFIYHRDPRPGVLTIPGQNYSEPYLRQFQFPELGELNDPGPESQRLQDISVMMLKRIYGCVGEQVFVDQMALSGMDRVLLLPVAAETSTPEQFNCRMRWIKQYYCDGDTFSTAGSIPGTVPSADIAAYVCALKQEHDIRAIKCHPVISGIDLSTSARKEWLEGVLAACHESRLPLIIHGGRNNPYWSGKRGNFGALGHLAAVRFYLSGQPVILAHAGLHRCNTRDIESEHLPMLRKMLRHNPNLYVDISALGFEPLKLVLQSVDPDRVLFGSDALYCQQWEAVAMTMHALRGVGMALEENLVRFSSINPRKTIFKDNTYANTAQNPVEPVRGRGEGEVVS